MTDVRCPMTDDQCRMNVKFVIARNEAVSVVLLKDCFAPRIFEIHIFRTLVKSTFLFHLLIINFSYRFK